MIYQKNFLCVCLTAGLLAGSGLMGCSKHTATGYSDTAVAANAEFAKKQSVLINAEQLKAHPLPQVNVNGSSATINLTNDSASKP